MTAGSSQPTVVPSWNPNKHAAPTPPTGLAAGGSGAPPGSSGAPSLHTNNYPDVAADAGDLYDPGDQMSETNISEQNVVPDYPMDSLPRNYRSRPPDPGEIVMRTGQNSSGSRTNVRTSPQSSDGTQTMLSVTSLPPVTRLVTPHPVVTTTAQRSSGASVPPPHVYSASHLSDTHSQPIVSHSQPIVSHSNVSVSVNHYMPAPGAGGDPRHIRTQDLNVGVVSRLDHHRLPANALPDIVTHSQPPPSTRPIPNSTRSTVVDPRVSQGHQSADPHSPHSRHHRDHRHSRSRRHSRRQASADEPCKASCYRCLAVGTSFRWILVVLSLLGVCCVVTGIVLAALHATGNSFLFLAIMFIGLGVLLVVVVGVGWKCTPRGHEPLHALFNLGDFRSRRSRRHRSHHRRDGRWHGGTMYPEFQYRRPPPSYTASMQEYQHQLMLAQQNQTTPDLYDPDNIPDEDYSLPSSPPPSYRSRASTLRAGIQITFPPNHGGDFPDSRPPTYRSHPSGTLPGHGRSRPRLSQDDDDDDDDVDTAPADVAFTGSTVIVDTNTSQNSTSIQIAPTIVSNQNVTVSVTTVSVTSQPVSSHTSHLTSPAADGQIVRVAPGNDTDISSIVDPVGDMEADRIDTQL